MEDSKISLAVIKVPRTDYKMRPVYVGENLYKGTFKRNHESDYHAAVKGLATTKNRRYMKGNSLLSIMEAFLSIAEPY